MVAFSLQEQGVGQVVLEEIIELFNIIVQVKYIIEELKRRKVVAWLQLSRCRHN